MLTEKDKRLIAEAGKMPPQLWYMVDDLIRQAESDEARDRLRFIYSMLKYEEEDEAGLL